MRENEEGGGKAGQSARWQTPQSEADRRRDLVGVFENALLSMEAIWRLSRRL